MEKVVKTIQEVTLVTIEKAEALASVLKLTPGVILYNTELDPAVIQRIGDLELRLESMPAITNQAAADQINSVLKEAKSLDALIKAQGLDLRRPINAAADSIKAVEDSALKSLRALVATLNAKCLNWSKEVENKRLQEEQRIREESQKKANDEIARVQKIQQTKKEFHESALKTINSIDTIEVADLRYKQLQTLKFDPTVYQEFLEEVESLRPSLLEKIEGRKKAILENIEIDQEAVKAELDKVSQDAIKETAAATMNVMANVDMEADLKKSQLDSAKNIQKRWKYKGCPDIREVPYQYLMVDEKAVNEAIKQGKHSIPGLIIEQEISNISR